MNTIDLLMQELQQPQSAPQPMFTPEQIKQRLAQNNQQMELGVLGQLAGDSRVRGVGGGVFKQAMSARDPRITNRGITDTLTGETAIDPEYAAEREGQRRDKILQQALNYESRREAEKARAAEAENNRVFRRSLANIAANNRRGPAMKPPSGYRFDANGNLEPIPGGPAASKEGARNRADAMRLEGITTRVGQINSLIDRAREQVGPFTTGAAGVVTSKVPGGEAYDLRKTIDSIKANIGFQELQAMREASPTGGALGQVAVQELNFLQSVLGSLDADQSEEQLRTNLDAVQAHFNRWLEAVQMANGPRSGGADGTWDSPTPAAPQGGTVPPAAAPSTAPAQGGGTRYIWRNGQLVPK